MLTCYLCAVSLTPVFLGRNQSDFSSRPREPAEACTYQFLYKLKFYLHFLKRVFSAIFHHVLINIYLYHVDFLHLFQMKVA